MFLLRLKWFRRALQLEGVKAHKFECFLVVAPRGSLDNLDPSDLEGLSMIQRGWRLKISLLN